MSLSEELVDIATRHQVHLEGLKAGEVNKTDAIFVALAIDLERILLRLSVTDLSALSSIERARLVEAIRLKHTEKYELLLKELIVVLRETAVFEHQFEIDSVNEVLEDELEAAAEDEDGFAAALWARIQEAPMSATGKLLAAYLGSWLANEVTRSADLARRATAEGWSVYRLSAAYRGTKALNHTDGLWGSAKRNTRTTINTAVQHVSTTSRAEAMRAIVILPKGAARSGAGAITLDENGRITNIPLRVAALARRLGLRKGQRVKLNSYRWISVLDSGTTQICRSLDGQVFIFGKGPMPPMHGNCRSTIISEIPFAFRRRVSDTRPTASGPVPANLTYYEWLKRQPEAFQDDALGVTRARLFRKGGLSAAQFAKLNLGRDFKPLTLDQMRRLAPRAFKRAKL